MRARRAGIRDYLRAKKQECERCGYDRCVGALHFHHIGEKEISPSRMINDDWSKTRIDRELANTVVLCANCHAEEHFLNL